MAVAPGTSWRSPSSSPSSSFFICWKLSTYYYYPSGSSPPAARLARASHGPRHESPASRSCSRPD
eukprot:13480409-Alexandrium_andersonii.AAC.1